MALTGWNASQKITFTVAAAAIPSAQTNKPVLLNLSAASGLTAFDLSDIFTKLGSNSLKIAVEVGNTGVECKVEVEFWDNANSIAQLWAKAPSLSSSADTVLNIYYDETHANNTTNVGVVGSTPAVAVWSDTYSHVYHGSQIPSGAESIKDSLGTVNGTSVNMDSTDRVNAFIGKGLEFNGTNEHVTFAFGSNITTATVEISIKQTTGTAAAYDGIFTPYDDVGSTAMALIVGGAGGNVGFYRNNTGESSNLTISNFAVWNHLSFHISPTSEKITNHTLGTSESASDSIDRYLYATSALSRWYNDTRRFPGQVRGLFIAEGTILSDDWLAISYKSRTDTLGTYSEPIVETITLTEILEQEYEDCVNIVKILNQYYGLSIAAISNHNYTSEPVLTVVLEQYTESNPVVVKSISQPYSDCKVTLSSCDFVYSLNETLTKLLEQVNNIAGVVLTKTSDGIYNINSATLVSQHSSQVYVIYPDPVIVEEDIDVKVTDEGTGENGVPPGTIRSIGILAGEIKYSQSSYIVTGSVSLSDEQLWESINVLDSFSLTVNGLTHKLIATSKTRSESNGKLELGIELASPAITLGFPYAKEIDSSFVVSGTMSQIVNDLAALGDMSVVWEISVDDVLTSSEVQVEGESPIDVIREIVNELGGKLQSHPDGTIHAVPHYKVDSDKYSTDSPVKAFSSGTDFFSMSEETDKRDGFNKYSITSSTTSTGWKFTDEAVNDSLYKLKAWKNPWVTTEPTVTTSELTNVTISAASVIEEELEEEVEIVSGSGKVNEFCYGLTSTDYKTSTNLGVISITEDGEVTSEVVGNTLVTIKYITKYWAWDASNPDKESVQFILEA